MAATPRPNLGRRVRLAVAGAAVVTALTVASAEASVPTPDRGCNRDAGLPGWVPAPATTPAPAARPEGSCWSGAALRPVAIPRRPGGDRTLGINPTGINDRRQIVGELR